MNNLKAMLISVIAIMFLSTNTFAGSFGVGASGSMAIIEAEGSETEGTAAEVNNKANVSNRAMIGSFFAEYTFDGMGGMTIGIDTIPGSADVSSSALKRNDLETSKTGTVATTANSVDRTAQAEVENVMTFYAELPVHAGVYLKAGYTQMDVNTTEVLETGLSYGNTDVNGTMLGVGFKSDIGSSAFYKVEGSYTAFDSLSLNEAGQSANSAQNTVTADLDVTKLTFGLGFKF